MNFIDSASFILLIVFIADAFSRPDKRGDPGRRRTAEGRGLCARIHDGL